MWRYTADLLFILENPAVREAFFPTSEHRYFVEPARPGDWPAIRGDRDAARAAGVGRDPRGLVAPPARARSGPPATAPGASPGCSPWDRSSTGDPAVAVRCRSAGPDLARPRASIAGAARSARAVHPLRMRAPGRPDGAGRRGADPRPQAACTWSSGPSCAASTTSCRSWYGPASPWTRSGSRHPRCPGHDRWRRVLRATVLDFGPASVDGWLTRIIATELQIDEDSILDVAQHQLVLGGPAGRPHQARVRGLQVPLRAAGHGRRAGVAAARRVGLRLRRRQQRDRGPVKSLRRKLGDRASSIETVRGLGYRFVASA